MRSISDEALTALGGSRSGDDLIVWPWRDGSVLTDAPLSVTSWSLDGELSRGADSLSLTVADSTGQLAPWLVDDPLGIAGTRLQVGFLVGGSDELVNLGWYVITASEPEERWRPILLAERGTVTAGSPVPRDHRLIMAPGGATISLKCEGLSAVAIDDKLLAPESPVGAQPTVLGEIRRILDDIMPVVTASGVVDAAVSKSLVYDQATPRWEVCQDLAKRIGCDLRMTGDGQAEVFPLAAQPAQATIAGGPEGLLVQVDRAMSVDRLYNIFVAEGSGEVPVRGIAQITEGPLRVDGPIGRRPMFFSSQMVVTAAQAQAAAEQMRDTLVSGLTTELTVTCLPQPHIQQGDWVRVYTPSPTLTAPALVGQVTACKLSGSPVPGPMTLTVSCTYADVQTALSGGASNSSIAGPVLLNQP